MTLLWVVVGIVVLTAVALAASGGLGGLGAAWTDRPDPVLPARALQPGDVDQLRLSVGLRGYRMDEVDAVLDRVAAELAGRDARIADLEMRLNRGGEAPRG